MFEMEQKSVGVAVRQSVLFGIPSVLVEMRPCPANKGQRMPKRYFQGLGPRAQRSLHTRRRSWSAQKVMKSPYLRCEVVSFLISASLFYRSVFSNQWKVRRNIDFSTSFHPLSYPVHRHVCRASTASSTCGSNMQLIFGH